MLASFATNHKNSKGRLHKEAASKNRSPFQRDRDRIIHSQSFRRLEYKTQVFVNYESDHFRTRLTHSLEVAQISRAIAKKLKLDQDLAECLALAHDIGHPPFGHAGEDALNIVMKNYGGFDHNAQALKILTKLEDPYAEYSGLNLSFETLEGIIKHNGPLKNAKKLPKAIKDYNALHNLELKLNPGLEAQIAALADDIAYNNHDIDDGLRSGLLKEKTIRESKLVDSAYAQVDKKYPKLAEHKRLHEMRRIIYSILVDDVISETEKNLERYKIVTLEDIRKRKKPIANFSAGVFKEIIKLKKILRQEVYTDPEVQIMNNKAHLIITDLFDFYFSNQECIAKQYLSRLATKRTKRDQARVICDFIAGMTDRYAIKKHQQIFDLYSLKPNFK